MIHIEIKKFLNKIYKIDINSIHHFGYDKKFNKYKVVYQNLQNTYTLYIEPKILRNILLRIKINNILNISNILKKN